MSQHPELFPIPVQQKIRAMVAGDRMKIGAFHVLGHDMACQVTRSIATTQNAGMSTGEEAESVNSLLVPSSASLRKMRSVALDR